jgi:DNA (cytosine-5)-methyltransferase 1
VNVGSLFAGIGGFDLGFERCGMRVAWQVEQDAYCRAVLERHFPGAERFEDVREVGAQNLAPVDLICGGFPCQDLSSAGRGAGLDGARSGLWAEFARIIRELRPSYVVVENVPALLTGKGKRWERAPIGRVLGDLAEVGYDAEWSVLSAREFGAPHLRKRVWIVAYPARDAEARTASASGPQRERARQGGAESRARDSSVPPVADTEGESERAGLRASGAPRQRRRRPADRGGARGDVADPERGRREGRSDQPGRGDPERSQAFRGQGAAHPARGCEAGGLGESHPASEGWSVEPDVGRVADGVPNRVDRLAALGNALLPQIAEWIGQRILEFKRRSGGPG